MLRSNHPGAGRHGVTAVEATVAIGACLFFMFAIFEYGRFVMLRHLLDNAAREGARLAVVNTSKLTNNDIQNTVINYLAGQPINVTSFDVYMADPATGNNIGSWNNAAFGDGIAVDVAASYTPILPTFGFLPNPVVLKAKVLMRSEAN